MSHVDNVIVSWNLGEDSGRLEHINRWMAENDPQGQQFKDLSEQYDSYGGHKAFETVLLVGAFNYMPEERFLGFLASLLWEDPENVQYIVKREHSDRFEIVNLAQGMDDERF